MLTARLVFVLSMATFAAGTDDGERIRSVLRGFNEASRKAEPRLFRTLFTPHANYRDGARSLNGADEIISLFTDRQVWSERTTPVLQEPSIRLVGSSAAFVDAQLVQYGSMVVRSAVPVVLLLEKTESAEWKISSWRMSACPIPIAP
jgi:hypothetical protein